MNETCPYCGHGNAAYTSVTPVLNVPRDGDYSLCLACGFWGIFEHGAIRKPDKVEMAMIVRNADCMRAMDAWVDVMKMQRIAGGSLC